MQDARDVQIHEYQLQVKSLTAAAEQIGMELRAAEDRVEALQREVRDGWKDEIGRREKRIKELEGQIGGLTKLLQVRENEVREREDRVNELNIEITKMAHPAETGQRPEA